MNAKNPQFNQKDSEQKKQRLKKNKITKGVKENLLFPRVFLKGSMKELKETKSKFLKVRCNKCKNEQKIFEKASNKINCLVCNELLAEPTGGKVKVHGRILEVLE